MISWLLEPEAPQSTSEHPDRHMGVLRLPPLKAFKSRGRGVRQLAACSKQLCIGLLGLSYQTGHPATPARAQTLTLRSAQCGPHALSKIGRSLQGHSPLSGTPAV
eukprot:scaffold24918_cov131-Isochrysis_galbana.AAC.5